MRTRSRRAVQLAATSTFAFTTSVFGVTTASAAPAQSLPAISLQGLAAASGDTAHLELYGGHGDKMASADVTASLGLGTVTISGTVTDEKADSRCAYIYYKVLTAFGIDKSDKLVRVCGIGRSDSKTHRWVQLGIERFDAVDFWVCREQGLGRDRCSDGVRISF